MIFLRTAFSKAVFIFSATSGVNASFIIFDDTVKKCFTEFNKDPFGFDKRVKRADAEYYRAESDNWKSVLQKAGYSVTVNAKLRRAGDENMVPSS